MKNLNFKRYHLPLMITMLWTCLLGTSARSECFVIDGAGKIPFDGKTLERLMIEKKSLTLLNSQFRGLNVIEEVFKGKLQTCSHCTEKHIVCSQ